MLLTIKSSEIEVTVNTFAGAIESIQDTASGEEHYWPYDPAVWPRRTQICFPICGALPDGKYRHNGKEYSLPPHGFLREKELQVESQREDEIVFSLVSDGTTRENYPFDFRFELTERVFGRSLEIVYKVRNTGNDDMFFSVGAHYTYALPAAQKDCCYFFSQPQKAGRIMRKSGRLEYDSADIFGGKDKLSMDGLFDPSSVIVELCEINSEYIAIGTEQGLFTKVSGEGFPYLVLWAPPGGSSPFACIEYWAGMGEYEGNDGELAHKKGINRLLPGEERLFTQRITV